MLTRTSETIFLASEESPVGRAWKQSILASASEAWVQLDFFNDIRPNPGALGYGTRMRALRTEFTDRWQRRADDVRADPTSALTEIANAATEGRLEELLVAGGQSAGLVGEILPAGDIVQMLVLEAESALADAASLLS